MILVDTSVLAAAMDDTHGHCRDCRQALEHWGSREALAINAIIYAELAVALDDRTDLDQKLELFERLDFPWEAAWVAARAFEQHLISAGRKGAKLCPLPDYFIRAHALVANLPHLTLDSRQTSYFPGLRLMPLTP